MADKNYGIIGYYTDPEVPWKEKLASLIKLFTGLFKYFSKKDETNG